MMKTALKQLGRVLALSLFRDVYTGFTLMLFWNWFVVPLGVPRIDLFQGIAFFLAISLLGHFGLKMMGSEYEERHRISKTTFGLPAYLFVSRFAVITMILAVGAILKALSAFFGGTP